MTELALNLVRGLWGKEVLRRKIGALQEKYTRSLELMKTLVETNKVQASAIANLERNDTELRTFIEATLGATKIIDPNAKCPGCGATDGRLTHVARNGEVRIVNNCNRCGLPFLSSEPVAGSEKCNAAYQAPMTGLLRE